MGYRDDLYRVENIIGYTGQLHAFPSVYFRTATLAGHITQKHDYSQNVGRQAVFDATDYDIRNEDTPEGRRSREYVNGKCIHTSRSLFTPCNGGDGMTVDLDTLAILAQAIRKYPDEKQISGYGRETRRQIKAARAAKEAAHGAMGL